jgi:putative acetyltransferase
MQPKGAMNFHLRRGDRTDHASMLTLWDRSARATHAFLQQNEIETLRPLVAKEFAGAVVDWWLLVDDENRAVGFLGYSINCIEGLFIDPDFRGRGAGRLLVVTQWALPPDLCVSTPTNRTKTRGVFTRRCTL